MRKISWWAKQNPWKARVTIAILYVLITASALYMAGNLLALSIQASGWLLFAALALFAGGALYYPYKKRRNTYPPTFNFYARQKTCDWMLAFSAFLLVGFIGNTSGNPFFFSGIIKGASTGSISLAPVPVPAKEGKKSSVTFKPTKSERKALLKELKKLLRQSLHDQRERDINKGTRVSLLILSIIGGVVLSMLLATISCSLACSGADTLAILVLAFGTAAIVGLLVLTIRGIYHRYPKVLVPAGSTGNAT